MGKKVLAILGIILVPCCITASCYLPEREETLTEGETLYNAYLGLELTIPAGWYLVEHNEDNLTYEPEGCSDYGDMVFEDDDYYGTASMLTIQSRSDSAEDDHAEFTVYAEDCRELFPTLQEYTEDFIFEYEGIRDNQYEYHFEREEQTTVGGVPFTKLVFDVSHPDNPVSFIEEYYVTVIEDLYFFFYINYWPDSYNGEEMARNLLNYNVALSKEAEPEHNQFDGEGAAGTYYNGYLKLTVMVPENAIVAALNQKNLTFRQSESQNLEAMERIELAQGGYRFPLITMSTQILANDSGHAMLDLYAESRSDVMTLDTYVDLVLTESLYSEEDDLQAELVGQDSITINEWTYQRLTIYVSGRGNEDPYMEEYYISQVGDLFFVAYVNYLQDNERSKIMAMELLNRCFYFDDELTDFVPSSDVPQTIMEKTFSADEPQLIAIRRFAPCPVWNRQ